MESGFNGYVTIFGGDGLNCVTIGGMGIISLNIFPISTLFFFALLCLLPERFGILAANEDGYSASASLNTTSRSLIVAPSG